MGPGAWNRDILVEVLSSPSTFVGRMKLYSINGPSAYSTLLFDFRIHLGPFEAPATLKEPEVCSNVKSDTT